MKCPKCQYVGFDAGRRCRNCGYDFSLLAFAEAPAAEPDLFLRPPDREVDGDGAAASRAVDVPLRTATRARARPIAAELPDLDQGGGHTVSPPLGRVAGGVAGDTPARTGLPLFPADTSDDEPLITVPPAPRPPLAVRKTPDLPRAARAPRVVRREERPRLVDTAPEITVMHDVAPLPLAPLAAPLALPAVPQENCAPRRRLLAALIDLGILLALDLVVVSFTLRMAGLAPGEWTRLPVLPMGSFLAGVTMAYVAAFTAIGGQTIGKMALQIRVVTEEDRLLRPGRAIGRTLAAAVSLLPLGAGFVPALFAGGRTLHDRLARTRVVPVQPVAAA